MNLAVYNCDWTEQSLEFKKLFFLTLLVNNVKKLKLKVSPSKIINLKMFATVCI